MLIEMLRDYGSRAVDFLDRGGTAGAAGGASSLAETLLGERPVTFTDLFEKLGVKDGPDHETPIAPKPDDDGGGHEDCIPISFFGDLAKRLVDDAVRSLLEKSKDL